MDRRDFVRLFLRIASIAAIPETPFSEAVRDQFNMEGWRFLNDSGTYGIPDAVLQWGVTDVNGYAEFPLAFESAPFIVHFQPYLDLSGLAPPRLELMNATQLQLQGGRCMYIAVGCA